jgi:tRNA-dihydrouridine synthase A
LFAGAAGARAFRRHLAIEGVKAEAGIGIFRAALAHVRNRAMQRVAA